MGNGAALAASVLAPILDSTNTRAMPHPLHPTTCLARVLPINAKGFWKA